LLAERWHILPDNKVVYGKLFGLVVDLQFETVREKRLESKFSLVERRVCCHGDVKLRRSGESLVVREFSAGVRDAM